MQSHLNGPIVGGRLGAANTTHSCRILEAQTTSGASTDLKVLSIDGATDRPIGYRIFAVVEQAFTDAGADTLSVGTASGGTQILNAVDVKAAAGTNYVPTNLVGIATSEVAIWARVTRASTPAQTGKICLFIELFDVNTKIPTTTGD